MSTSETVHHYFPRAQAHMLITIKPTGAEKIAVSKDLFTLVRCDIPRLKQEVDQAHLFQPTSTRKNKRASAENCMTFSEKHFFLKAMAYKQLFKKILILQKIFQEKACYCRFNVYTFPS